MLKYAVRTNGAEWTRIHVVNAGTPDEMERAFRESAGDYVQLQGPAAQELEREGVGWIAVSVGESMPPVAFSSLCCSREFLQTDTCRSFVEAFSQAREWVRDSQAEEIAQTVAPFFPDVAIDALTAAVRAYQHLGCWAGETEIPFDLYEQALNVFESEQEISRRFPYDEVCDASVARRAIASLRVPSSGVVIRSPYFPHQPQPIAFKRFPSSTLPPEAGELPEPVHHVSLGRIAGAAIGVFGSVLVGGMNPSLPIPPTPVLSSASAKVAASAHFSAALKYSAPSVDQANVNLADLVVECSGRIQLALTGQIDPAFLQHFDRQSLQLVAMNLAILGTVAVAGQSFRGRATTTLPLRLRSEDEIEKLLNDMRSVQVSLDSSIRFGDYTQLLRNKAEYAKVLVDAGWTPERAAIAANAASGQILSTIADHFATSSRHRPIPASAANEYDFFISHASSDKLLAEGLYELLEPHARIFLDTRNLQPGAQWPRAISRSIDSARIVVFLISPRSEEAYFQQEEVLRAINNAKADSSLRLVPIFLDDISADLKIPFGLASRQGIVLSRMKGLEEVSQQLLAMLPPGGLARA